MAHNQAKTRESRPPGLAHSIQKVQYALYADGEYIPLPPGLRRASLEPARTRSFPHSGPFRGQRPDTGRAMSTCF
jgi:hypothetical protein